ncbi:coiled-coil domain-containing protein 105 isoform X2 [Protopterus annectens]|uniref:coiled-coil domain-containing protein 105 isoform X2 n=1 Tax=Protopterus annectens TaxID=7888 RepID=UPI001CFC04CC|nr:coiled-coil domain-containing protein 105 isoform X2 [Protopterus annectens]
MSAKVITLPTATIGPKSWQKAAISNVQFADKVVSRAAQGTKGGSAVAVSGTGLPSQFKIKSWELKATEEDFTKKDIVTQRNMKLQSSPVVGPVGQNWGYSDEPGIFTSKNGNCEEAELLENTENQKEKLSGGQLTEQPNYCWLLDENSGFKDPPPFYRDMCAEQCNRLILAYTRDTRALVAMLREHIVYTNEEVKKMLLEKGRLEKTLANLRKDIMVNRHSMELRIRRPLNERVHDGADLLLEAERSQLLKLKWELEAKLASTNEQLKTLDMCRKRLNECSAERSRALDLTAHTMTGPVHEGGQESRNGRESITPSRAASRREERPETPKPNSLGSFTPECKEAMDAAKEACSSSKQLRKAIKEAIDNAVTLQRSAHKSVNAGVTQKMAETVSLMQYLQMSSAKTRTAVHRVHRCYDEFEMSQGLNMGPLSSADLQVREKLNRPLVQVYQRHAGNQLPEGLALVQMRLKSQSSLFLEPDNEGRPLTYFILPCFRNLSFATFS